MENDVDRRMAGTKGITSFKNMSVLVKTKCSALQDGKGIIQYPFHYGSGVQYRLSNLALVAAIAKAGIRVGWAHQKQLRCSVQLFLLESHPVTRFFRITRGSVLEPLGSSDSCEIKATSGFENGV